MAEQHAMSHRRASEDEIAAEPDSLVRAFMLLGWNRQQAIEYAEVHRSLNNPAEEGGNT